MKITHLINGLLVLFLWVIWPLRIQGAQINMVVMQAQSPITVIAAERGRHALVCNTGQDTSYKWLSLFLVTCLLVVVESAGRQAFAHSGGLDIWSAMRAVSPRLSQ